MAYHNHEEPFREVAAASLPESQPSPSGDELLWEFMAPFIGPTGGWLVSPKKFHAAIADWLRSHDAKVSGQAEQRLREALNRSLVTISFFASVIKSGEQWSLTCQKAFDQACKDRAALQESPK